MILLLFIFLFILNSIAYDEMLAKYGTELAQSSYVVNTTSEWNCKTCNSDIVLEYIIENNGAKALQGYDKLTNSIFVSYRGSSNINNWINNIQIKKINPYNDTNIYISKGFYTEYSYLKNDILNNLKLLTNKYNNNNIFIVGHSSGGAIATLLAFDVLNMNIYNLSYLMTFGSPRVGNKYFSYYMNNNLFTSYRLTHYYDMVPHVPEQILGYEHISNEIWYDENNSKYKICNDKVEEDNNCSNSCSPLKCTSIDDHLNYLNVSMGSNY